MQKEKSGPRKFSEIELDYLSYNCKNNVVHFQYHANLTLLSYYGNTSVSDAFRNLPHLCLRQTNRIHRERQKTPTNKAAISKSDSFIIPIPRVSFEFTVPGLSCLQHTAKASSPYIN